MKIFIYEHISAGGVAAPPPSLAAEGWGMLASLARDLAAADGVEEVAALLAPGLAGRAADLGPRARAVIAGAGTDAGGGDRLFDALAAACDATLVIAPESDGVHLERARRALAAGGRLLGSPPAAIELAGDKLLLSRRLRALGIPAPPLVEARRGGSGGIAFPAVLKPRRGAGALFTYRVEAPEDLPRALETARAEGAPEDLVLGPFIPGIAASATFLVAAAGATALAPGRQIISDDGRFRYLGGRIPIESPQLRARAAALARRALAAVPDLRGLAGVDLVLDGGGSGDRVIEINPRPTTSFLGLRSVHAGWGIARNWVESFRGARDGAAPEPEAPIDPGAEAEFRVDGSLLEVA